VGCPSDVSMFAATYFSEASRRRFDAALYGATRCLVHTSPLAWLHRWGNEPQGWYCLVFILIMHVCSGRRCSILTSATESLTKQHPTQTIPEKRPLPCELDYGGTLEV